MEEILQMLRSLQYSIQNAQEDTASPAYALCGWLDDIDKIVDKIIAMGYYEVEQYCPKCLTNNPITGRIEEGDTAFVKVTCYMCGNEWKYFFTRKEL